MEAYLIGKYLPARWPILLTHIKVKFLLEGSDLWFLGIYGGKDCLEQHISCCLLYKTYCYYLTSFDIPKTILKCISKQNLLKVYHVAQEF